MPIQKTYWGHIDWLYTHSEAKPGQSMNNIGLCVIAPGQRQFQHVHYGEEQFIYILQGESIQIVDDMEIELHQGMHMLIRAGATHETINTGTTPIIELLVSTPVSYRTELPSAGEAYDCNGNIYAAVEAIRTQLMESFQVPFTIFDASGVIVLQNNLFPSFCVNKCRPNDRQGPCECLNTPETLMHWDYRHQWFVCRHGLLVYHLPIFFRNVKLGAVRGGHIVLSDVSGDYGHQEIYDTPQSTAVGIRNVLGQIITSILAYCEFDSARNELACKNKELSREVRHTKRLERNLRLVEDKVTTLRINRHFLFNTLNCMADMALHNYTESLYSAIIHLSKLFRYVTPGNERRFVSLSEELEYLNNYLALQKFRYGENLRITQSCDPVLYAIQVPFNFLQPVLENAFLHGFQDVTGLKTILIEAYRRNEELVINISNNGALPDNTTAHRIQKSLTSYNGHGLSLIYTKLEAAYGKNFSINIYSDELICVSITIPVAIKTGMP